MNRPSSVYFIDRQVEGFEQLLEDIPRGAAVVLIDPEQDGVWLIAEYLEQCCALKAIHIISHGSAGQVQLGNANLNLSTLDDYAGELAVLGRSLAEGGDLLLYGCNVASGENGVRFVEAVAAATGADVAASEDLTGSALAGANWQLQCKRGAIEAPMLHSAGFAGVLGEGDGPTPKPRLIPGNGRLLMPGNGANGVVQQADGKLIVVGNGSNGSDSDVMLQRLNADGSVDTGYASGGTVLTDFSGDNGYAYYATLQSDGKLLVVGRTTPGGGGMKGPSGPPVSILLRYNTDGSLDSSFDSDGRVDVSAFDIPSVAGEHMAALQSDGKIILVGSKWIGGSPYIHVGRFNSDGSVDTGFSGDGVAVSPREYGHAYSTAVQSDGKILVAGDAHSYYTGTTGADFSLERYTDAGVRDTALDGDGEATLNVGSGTGARRDRAYSMLVQPDGKIVMVGHVEVADYGDFGLVRYNANGTLDTTFGTGGVVISDFGDTDTPVSMLRQSDGKIVVVGWTEMPTGGGDVERDILVARYNADGSLDTGFGSSGRVITDIARSEDTAGGAVLQSDGKIVVVGTAVNGLGAIVDGDATRYEPFVLRYNTDGSLDTGFNSRTYTERWLGTVNDDTLTGTSARDRLEGKDGNDTLSGLADNDRLLGGAGNDILNGGPGNDYLDGGGDNDTLRGNDGNDYYVVGNGNDTVVEKHGEGTDKVSSSRNFTLPAHVENLTLSGSGHWRGSGNGLANTILGNRGNNLLKGNGGNDILRGNDGNDTLDGGPGNDTLRGNRGNDVYVVNAPGDKTLERKGEGTDTVRSSVNRTLGANIENLELLGGKALKGTGNSLRNTLVGNKAGNLLKGLDGNDVLRGMGGNDTLFGGKGADTHTGGGGKDRIKFFHPDEGGDTVTDFRSGADRIQVTGKNFHKLPKGVLQAKHFVANSTGKAVDGDDYFIFNTKTRTLYYDSNGNKAGGRVKLVQFTSKVRLKHTDLAVT